MAWTAGTAAEVAVAGQRTAGGELFDPMTVLASGAAYSPDPRLPLGFALAFDPDTGIVDEAVFARWLRFDPVEICQKSRIDEPSLACASSSSTVGCATNTSSTSPPVPRRRACVRPTSPCSTRSSTTVTRGTQYRYDRSLPLLARAIS